ncbi:hypothetical protein CFR75_05430 [Komagataeibacter xylinus]|uniref:Uncharacterized protein n=1 Tax=Komagataeibacter xylinus TaxID=28448 RepID=A0A318PKC3_KOMXY|nr:hypothetical protein CFR75_05430 [Komagataeibacter xylinus]
MAPRFGGRVQQQRGKPASIFILLIIMIIIIKDTTRGSPDRFPTVDFPTLPTETYGITCTRVMPFFMEARHCVHLVIDPPPQPEDDTCLRIHESMPLACRQSRATDCPDNRPWRAGGS